MTNTLNRSLQIFIKLMIFNGSVLFSMSLQRLVLFLVVVRHWIFGTDGMTIAASFINGARFDLCVLGFINIPILFITWAISTDFMVRTPSKALQFLRKWILGIYLGLTTLAIHVLGLFDMMFFAASSRRWTYYDWQETGFSFFGRVASAWGWFFTLAVITLFIILWVIRCIFTLYKLQLHGLPIENINFGKSKAVLFVVGFILPLFVVGLAARGTWTAHHLNREHAEVSQIQALSQMTLSPVWAFDKKF